MIYLPCLLSRNFFNGFKVFFLILLLPSCASLGDAIFASPPDQENLGPSVTRKKRQTKANLERLEWAIQNYEAGSYQKAVDQFHPLLQEGSELGSFELVPFYLGMSYFRLKKYPEAITHLEKFLQLNTPRREVQETLLTLVSIQEQLNQWDKVLGLATEADKLTLFQNNRVYLKLVWARALAEKGELKGARATLKEASLYLDETFARESFGPKDLDQDLWGRFHFTTLFLEELQCRSLAPRSTGNPKAGPGKRLYGNWLGAVVDCHKKNMGLLVEKLLREDSGWGELALGMMAKSLSLLEIQLKKYLQLEAEHLKDKANLLNLTRENLYGLLARVDESIKLLHGQNMPTDSLLTLRKQLDLLIVSL